MKINNLVWHPVKETYGRSELPASIPNTYLVRTKTVGCMLADVYPDWEKTDTYFLGIHTAGGLIPASLMGATHVAVIDLNEIVIQYEEGGAA